MSVILNIDMPKTCEECNLESICDLWVEARKMCGEWKPETKATIRHPECPLSEPEDTERLKIYIEFYKSCLNRLLEMYPNPEAKEMYELGVKDGADLAWMHGSDATAHELEKVYFQGMDDAMKMCNVQPTVHGKWIMADDGDGKICSICRTDYCHIVLPVDEWIFCPTCGAKMDAI